MREIPLKEFIEDYEKGLIKEVLYIGEPTRLVIGKSVKGMADKPLGYEIVYTIPIPLAP